MGKFFPNTTEEQIEYYRRAWGCMMAVLYLEERPETEQEGDELLEIEAEIVALGGRIPKDVIVYAREECWYRTPEPRFKLID